MSSTILGTSNTSMYMTDNDPALMNSTFIERRYTINK